MARSYKKNDFIKDRNPYMKRLSNKRLRRKTKTVLSQYTGTRYPLYWEEEPQFPLRDELTNRWCVCDYVFRKVLSFQNVKESRYYDGDVDYGSEEHINVWGHKVQYHKGHYRLMK